MAGGGRRIGAGPYPGSIQRKRNQEALRWLSLGKKTREAAEALLDHADPTIRLRTIQTVLRYTLPVLSTHSESNVTSSLAVSVSREEVVTSLQARAQRIERYFGRSIYEMLSSNPEQTDGR